MSWAPGQKARRKYATLFLKTDANGDGIVEHAEAMLLLQRSGLDQQTLNLVFAHSDRDQDGRLQWVEFLCMAHLVTCVRRGAQLPGLHEGLPQELLQVLGSMTETPQELALQRSRSASPVVSGRQTPVAPDSPLHAPWPEPETTPAWPGTSNFPDDGFPPVPDTGMEDFDFATQPKKEKKQKKEKREEELPQWDTGGGDLFATEPYEPPFEPRYEYENVRPQGQGELSSMVKHFEAVIEADRALSKHLRREVDDLEQDLRNVRETKDQLERTVRQEQEDGDRANEQRRHLERQLQEKKQRLADLRDERRAVNLESISLRRDRDHYAEELQFLQRMAEEEEQTLETVRSSNQFLEKSQKTLELHTHQLEVQRKEVLAQVSKERELVRQEERQNAELRNKLERMRREQQQVAMSRQEASHRQERLRQYQTDGPPVPMSMDGRPRDPSRMESHSWAHNLTGGDRDPRGDVYGDYRDYRDPRDSRDSRDPRSRAELAPSGPRSREGV